MTSKPTLGPTNPRIISNESSFPRSSVSLSVYRELVREFQATRERVDSLKAQNHQLVKDNRQLRQEIEKIVGQGKHLDRLLQTLDETRGNDAPSFVIPVRARVITPPSRVPLRSEIKPESKPVISVPSIESRPQPSRNSWPIAIAIFLVVVTSGFGAFWLVSSTRR